MIDELIKEIKKDVKSFVKELEDEDFDSSFVFTSKKMKNLTVEEKIELINKVCLEYVSTVNDGVILSACNKYRNKQLSDVFIYVDVSEYVPEVKNEFVDTHWQNCTIAFNKDTFKLGVHNTGPHMVDRKRNSSPPWRDDCKNADVTGVMVLNKDLVTKLYPAIVAYCDSDEDFTTKANFKKDGHRKTFLDENKQECHIQTSSTAMYIGMWLGNSEYPMHLNIAKGRIIKKKMEEFLNQ